MSAAGGLVAKLAAAGIDPQLLADVAQALFVAEAKAEILDSRRKNERERKAKSRDVTGQDVTDADTPGPGFLDKEKSPRPPKEIKPSRERNPRARAKHPLPANWTPEPFKPDGQAGLIVARKPVGWIERQLSKFKDHALQNHRQCSCWDAAWRNWIKGTEDFDGNQRNSMGRNQPADGLSATTRAARDVFGLGAGH